MFVSLSKSCVALCLRVLVGSVSKYVTVSWYRGSQCVCVSFVGSVPHCLRVLVEYHTEYKGSLVVPVERSGAGRMAGRKRWEERLGGISKVEEVVEREQKVPGGEGAGGGEG